MFCSQPSHLLNGKRPLQPFLFAIFTLLQGRGERGGGEEIEAIGGYRISVFV